MSPFARRNYVGHNVYDHSSLLKMVEWRFGLPALTKRDRAARNIAESFNFAKPNFAKPHIPITIDPGPHICSDQLTKSPFSSAGIMGIEDPMWREMADSKTYMRGWESVL